MVVSLPMPHPPLPTRYADAAHADKHGLAPAGLGRGACVGLEGRGAGGDVGHMVEVGMEPRSGVAVSIRVRSDSAARGESGGVLSSVAPEGRVCGRRAEAIAVGLFEVSFVPGQIVFMV